MITELTGRVIARIDGKAMLIVVHDSDGHDVACKFWGRARAETDGVVVGCTVRVTGAIKSREYQGKWYTDYDCDRLVMTTAKAPAPGEEAEPPVDDDGIPF